MASRIEKGRWVEIHRVVLTPAERAPQVPEDTRQVPLEMRTKGFLARAAYQGEEVEIFTRGGRLLSGTLSEVNPGYSHGFGSPIAELLDIGIEVRALLENQGDPG